jgi:uncharacterized phage-associated protein
MIVDRGREKLINAIVYFVAHTKHCHTLKLFKLLNFLDFEHYRQTGRTVTGLTYVAWKQGPAPNDLWHELEKGGEPDLKKAVQIIRHKDDITDKLLRREIKPIAAFDKRIFTRRELAIMDRVAEFFEELKAEDMSEFSHKQGLPWREIFKKGDGEYHEIPEELALRSDPIVHDVPTIEDDELKYRRELLSGLS